MKSLLTKQTELAESAFRETLNLVREFKPAGTAQKTFAKQSDLACKTCDAAIESSRDIAELVKRLHVDAIKTIEDRIKVSIADICGSFENGGRGKKESPDRRAEKTRIPIWRR